MVDRSHQSVLQWAFVVDIRRKIKVCPERNVSGVLHTVVAVCYESIKLGAEDVRSSGDSLSVFLGDSFAA